MALFAYNPRYTDDYDISDILQFANELSRPAYDPRELRALRNSSNLSQLASLRESEVQDTDQEFRVKLHLGGCYRPEEVTVSSDNKRLIITAKHEEREDKHSMVSRQMTRIYTWPPGVDPKSCISTMNSQGCLLVRATKQPPEAPKDVQIPVEFKG